MSRSWQRISHKHVKTGFDAHFCARFGMFLHARKRFLVRCAQGSGIRGQGSGNEAPAFASRAIQVGREPAAVRCSLCADLCSQLPIPAFIKPPAHFPKNKARGEAALKPRGCRISLGFRPHPNDFLSAASSAIVEDVHYTGNPLRFLRVRPRWTRDESCF